MYHHLHNYHYRRHSAIDTSFPPRQKPDSSRSEEDRGFDVADRGIEYLRKTASSSRSNLYIERFPPLTVPAAFFHAPPPYTRPNLPRQGQQHCTFSLRHPLLTSAGPNSKSKGRSKGSMNRVPSRTSSSA